MWRISYKTLTLQDVLTMAYMNVLEAASYNRPAGTAGVQANIGNATDVESRHHRMQ